MSAMKQAKEEALDQERWSIKPDIQGIDINPKAISIAQFHAKQAGVEKYVRFTVGDARKFVCNRPFGVLISNPPYGERLLDEKTVQTLMRDFGKAFFALPDWNAYIFTALPELERYFGKRADKKKKFSNANLPCSLYCYLGKPPKSQDSQ